MLGYLPFLLVTFPNLIISLSCVFPAELTPVFVANDEPTQWQFSHRRQAPKAVAAALHQRVAKDATPRIGDVFFFCNDESV